MSRLRIGIIALEFPPQIGGMEEHALGVAKVLSTTDDIVVFTRAGYGLEGAPFQQKPVICGDLSKDAELLRNEHVDAWLALNGGYVALAPHLSVPMFAYFHGNDFLTPWVFTRTSFVSLLRRLPYFWRYANSIETTLKHREIKNGARSAPHLFANSTFTSELLHTQLSVPKEKITVIYPGVNDAFFQDGIEKTPSSVLRILTVARLTKITPKKNVDSCLRAVAILQDRLQMRYRIIGNGDDRARLQALAKELGLDNHVEFLGERAPSEMPSSYRDIDLFLLASKRSPKDVESFGISYLEAAAGGVPSICSAEGGSTEAVLDGISGLIIPNSSPQAIAAGILRFAESREHFAPEKIRSFAKRFRRPELVKQLRARMLDEIKYNTQT